MANYTYSLQHGGSDFGDVDHKGPATPSRISAAFDEFDWSHEVDKANRREGEGSSPTFSVEDEDSGRQFWVSAHGDPSNFVFVSHYAYPHRKRLLFGLIGRDGFGAPNCRQDLSLDDARRALDLFLEQRHDELVAIVASA